MAQIFAILPDQQIPLHDRHLHEVVCRWLELNKPDGITCSGDLIDLTMLSRFGWNPKIVRDPGTDTQRAIDETNKVLTDYKQARGGSGRDYLIPGNHEERLQRYIIANAPQLYGIKRAGAGDDVDSELSLAHLLGLKELGMEWVTGEDGEWPHAQVWLAKRLAVRHGWIVRKNSAASAYATLEHLGHSVIVGHTHRMGIAYRTRHDSDGTRAVICGVEAGTLALPTGLGYAVAPDWQQGFAVARVNDDGTFSVSLATYVNSTLIWEGQQLTYRKAKGVQVSA
jgi:hypothetical protein